MSKFTCGMCLCLLFVGCSPAADLPKPLRVGSDWPKFGGPNGDGSSPDVGIKKDWPKTGLKKVWEARLGAGYAPPSVADGRLFHFDGEDKKGVLTARNSETGKFLWKYEYDCRYEDLYGYDDGPRACPVVDGDRVYIYGVDGLLACLNVAEGKELWKLDTRKQYRFHQNFFGVGSVPLVVDDLLIVAIGGSPKGPRPADLREAKGDGSCLVAFDKKTGAEKYKLSDDLASYSSPMLVTLHKQPTAIYFARSGLIGFDPATGTERFTYKWRAKSLESVNAANPVVIGNNIVLSECYEKGTVCLKVSAQWKVEVVWSDAEADRGEKALMSHWCTPVADGDVFYGSSGRHESEADVRCIDAKTGTVKWTVPRTRRTTMTKIDGHLLMLSEDGTLTLAKLNADKFEKVAVWDERNNEDLANPCWAPPVVARGLVYLRGKGKLICCELCEKK